MMHSTMEQIAIKNGYARLFLRVPRNFEIFHDSFSDNVWGMALPL